MTAFRYYWEDFPAGRVFEYGSRQLSEKEIIEFARDWDPQRFHTDPVAAKSTPFGGLVASGWHTGAVMMRFMCDAYLNESSCIGSPGIEEWRFALPVRPGDTLRYRGTVMESRASASKPAPTYGSMRAPSSGCARPWSSRRRGPTGWPTRPACW